MKAFMCNIVGLKGGYLFSGEIHMIEASGTMGDFGVLAGHEPFLTTLEPGPLKITFIDGSEDVVYVSGGYLEVQPEQVIVLADETIRSKELDEQTITRQKSQAETQLKSNLISSEEYAATLINISKMAAQLRTVNTLRNLRR